jgi:putative modified peptide
MAQQPLPAQVVDQLLDLLATDDSFRELFARNPEAAFERLGYPPTPEQLVCCKPGKLASKDVIEETRAAMRSRLVLGTLSHVPNRWDEGYAGED